MTLVEQLKEYESNTKWIGSHYEGLKKKYPDEWVAVWKEKVVEYSSDLPSLMETLKEKYPDDCKRFSVKYIGIEDVHLILES